MIDSVAATQIHQRMNSVKLQDKSVTNPVDIVTVSMVDSFTTVSREKLGYL